MKIEFHVKQVNMKEERGRVKQRNTDWCDKYYNYSCIICIFSRFKVHYYKKKYIFEQGIKAGEGEILLLCPRHPEKGIKQDTPVTWKGALHDINVDLEAGQWGIGSQQGAEEVDSLTFCCWESCHGSYSLQDVDSWQFNLLLLGKLSWLVLFTRCFKCDVRGIPTVHHGEPIFYTSHVQGVSLWRLQRMYRS